MKETDFFPFPGWPPFAAGSGRTRFFGLGEVRLAVLSLISEGPKHGYQLMKDLASRLGPLYRASSGTVYPVLKQLEKEGLIASRLEEGRNMYRLTKTGTKLLSAEATPVAEIWSRAEQASEISHQFGPVSMVVASPLSELVRTALEASQWSTGDPDREDQVRGILRNASAALNGLMQPQRKAKS